MTEEQIRNAFKGQPLMAAILVVGGYLFMFTHAEWHELVLFTLGILAIVLNVFLAEHTIKTTPRWWIALPSFLFAVFCGLAGGLAIIYSMRRYLPQ